ncbi:outer membrane beta-barrel protein [uncultured Shewanella sp.]|uniref:outer membrane beta-barrel protein n=1 Tax=uncultured Shewanella sp. TaxID=173975 RepID=UPI00260752F4|nr:outer membrane beta-barrel protein [uncultured Shewanella sp.]
MKKITIATIILATTHITTAKANTDGFYLGGTLGTTHLDISSYSGTENSYGLISGYQFNHHLALEAQAFKTGNYHINPEQNAIKETQYQGRLNAQGISLAPKFIWPFHDTFSVYAKAGVSYTEINFDVYSTNTNENPLNDIDGWGYQFGLGIDAEMLPNWTIHLGYDFISGNLNENNAGQNVDKTTVKLTQFNFGLHYNF